MLSRRNEGLALNHTAYWETHITCGSLVQQVLVEGKKMARVDRSEVAVAY